MANETNLLQLFKIVILIAESLNNILIVDAGCLMSILKRPGIESYLPFQYFERQSFNITREMCCCLLLLCQAVFYLTYKRLSG